MGCQSTLLRLVEDWPRAMDNNEYVAAIRMDLSRAFDSLPHDLLLGKLRAYGLCDKACALIGSYLADRLQQVRLGAHCSEWSEIIKGAPHGSIIGPLLFNIFVNDIQYFLFQINLLFITMLMIIICVIPIEILMFSYTTCNMSVRQFYVGLKILICRPMPINFKQLVSAERVTI